VFQRRPPLVCLKRSVGSPMACDIDDGVVASGHIGVDSQLSRKCACRMGSQKGESGNERASLTQINLAAGDTAQTVDKWQCTLYSLFPP
jgi:hypothetical protein